MIAGLWDKIEVYYDTISSTIKMELTERNGVVAYECVSGADNPAGTSARRLVLPLKDFEKLLDRISAMIIDAVKNNEEANLKNTELSIGKFKYQIFEHNDIIKVKVRDIRISK